MVRESEQKLVYPSTTESIKPLALGIPGRCIAMRADSGAPTGVEVDCDVSTRIPVIAAVAGGGQALVLVRLLSEPIGMLSLKVPATGLTPGEVAPGRVLLPAATPPADRL